VSPLPIWPLLSHKAASALLRDVELHRLQNGIDSLLEEYAQSTEVETLKVITSGPIPPNPSELLGSEKLAQTLTALSSHFDYIVLDSPPSLLVTDSVILSTVVDGTVIVIDSDKTTRNQLKECAERLRDVNANLLGVVVNRLSPKADGYYYYYNYYYYKKKTDSTYGYMQGGATPSPNGGGVRGLLSRIPSRRSKTKPVDTIGSEPPTEPLDVDEPN
jgi:Mrp family chromosome partitioning ATPase